MRMEELLDVIDVVIIGIKQLLSGVEVLKR